MAYAAVLLVGALRRWNGVYARTIEILYR